MNRKRLFSRPYWVVEDLWSFQDIVCPFLPELGASDRLSSCEMSKRARMGKPFLTMYRGVATFVTLAHILMELVTGFGVYTSVVHLHTVRRGL